MLARALVMVVVFVSDSISFFFLKNRFNIFRINVRLNVYAYGSPANNTYFCVCVRVCVRQVCLNDKRSTKAQIENNQQKIEWRAEAKN